MTEKKWTPRRKKKVLNYESLLLGATCRRLILYFQDVSLTRNRTAILPEKCAADKGAEFNLLPSSKTKCWKKPNMILSLLFFNKRQDKTPKSCIKHN